MTKREKIGLILAILIGSAVEGLFYAIFCIAGKKLFVEYLIIAIPIAIIAGVIAWVEAHAERRGDAPLDR